MPKTFEEQRHEILGDTTLSLAERQARMLEVSERRTAAQPKSPEQLLAECRTPGEVAEVCRCCWAAQGDAEIQGDGTARFRKEPTTPRTPPQAQQNAADAGILRQAVRTPNGTVVLLEAYSNAGLDILIQAAREGRL